MKQNIDKDFYIENCEALLRVVEDLSKWKDRL